MELHKSSILDTLLQLRTPAFAFDGTGNLDTCNESAKELLSHLKEDELAAAYRQLENQCKMRLVLEQVPEKTNLTLRIPSPTGEPRTLSLDFHSLAFQGERAFVGVLSGAQAASGEGLRFSGDDGIIRGVRLMRRPAYSPKDNPLTTELPYLIAQARANNQGLALVYFHFESRDIIGRASLDTTWEKILDVAGDRIRSAVGSSCHIHRLSTNRIIALIPLGITSRPLEKILFNIHDAFLDPVRYDHRSCFLSFNMGTACFPRHGEDSHSLLTAVDTALYESRNSGINQSCIYNETMTVALERRALVEQRLFYALEGNALHLVFQPLVRMGDRCPVGYEVLIRWQDAVLGPISPGEFIRIAEETGLIIAIGDWVLERVFALVDQAVRAGVGLGKVAINISNLQFRRDHLLRKTRELLQRYAIGRDLIEYELTEGLLMEHSDWMLDNLRELKSMGISLSIDDFGTGYSSLSYLKKYPFDVLKLDIAFVSDSHLNHENALLCKVILEMAHALNLKVVAEGIELEEEHAFLQSLNCDMGQGYLFARPIPEEELRQRLGLPER
ncbi:MAG: hypothetical protein A2286_13220 [Gammaproteobacteria bacterium RIFOXYA12_FULL_61_12]|nr:MAG: hypothetical protein A2514_07300 [Gammaproteobacteria bacterium RIFOXYD12_FULL_61_37]OGT94084.1 MAG: hypothetical protein A2286_13220 [Gammaproteobacteria bacterium RIFOXYA12_FULL_61_12]